MSAIVKTIYRDGKGKVIKKVPGALITHNNSKFFFQDEDGETVKMEKDTTNVSIINHSVDAVTVLLNIPKDARYASQSELQKIQNFVLITTVLLPHITTNALNLQSTTTLSDFLNMFDDKKIGELAAIIKTALKDKKLNQQLNNKNWMTKHGLSADNSEKLAQVILYEVALLKDVNASFGGKFFSDSITLNDALINVGNLVTGNDHNASIYSKEFDPDICIAQYDI